MPNLNVEAKKAFIADVSVIAMRIYSIEQQIIIMQATRQSLIAQLASMNLKPNGVGGVVPLKEKESETPTPSVETKESESSSNTQGPPALTPEQKETLNAVSGS